jgi:hypothetical protein
MTDRDLLDAIRGNTPDDTSANEADDSEAVSSGAILGNAPRTRATA